MYLMESTSYVERPSFRPAQFSYPSNALGSSHGWREKPKCSCVVVVRRLDAFPSLPGIVPHRKKDEELSLNWRTEVTFGTILPKANTCPVQRERAAQKNVSCYTESPAGHRGPSGKAMIRRGTDHSFFHWGQVHERQLQTSHIRRLLTVGCSTPPRSHELNFVAFPRAKRMGAVLWVSFGAEGEERPQE
ncbi:hypothetical protein V8G54_000112 (mitochondrion) [Vigna mungo]|uniref:Uncharacterized protein n=1 Tax=Vigna mungo TaxID=3915 RepID=A0AAQ3MKL1_VIGMU